MTKTTIHSSNVTYFVICLLGIAAFFFVGVFPNLSTLQEMDDEIAELHDKVKTQEMLFPVYQKLIKTVTKEVPTKLSLPKKQKLSHNDLAGINEKFRLLAQDNQVAFIRAIPDVTNYLEDVGYLKMTIYFTGDFFNLRNLLLSVCQLPYLESIDEMRMETFNRNKRLGLKIKIAQE